MRKHKSNERAHDFYSGRGPDAKYLGTVFMADNVSKFADRLLSPHRPWREGNLPAKFTEATWEDSVHQFLTAREEISPEDVHRSWPHRHPNSMDTDYSWWFQSGGLYLMNLGALVEIRYPNGGIKSKLRFPDFPPIAKS